MADWFEPTLVLFPYAAWMFAGVGVPWALALLPRDVWRDRVTVIAVGMALGPLGFTTVMFVLGTVGHLTLTGTLIGSAALTALGAARAMQPVRAMPALPPAPAYTQRQFRLSRAEWLLIAGIVLLLLGNVIVTAYWPFIAHDTQWVYGYNARIFVLEERIPDNMGYYPQLVPLGYTAMQQAWGAFHAATFNDHAARVIVPWYNAAMVLMAYVLGRRVFKSWRVGLLTAAVWSFYPHVAAWSGAGDLEIPLTLYVTGAAVFFIEAWRTERARFAILSGLLLAGALWTKPTSGALVLGTGLALAGWLVWRREQRMLWWPKVRIVIIIGLASAPLGGMWYVRNLVLGHTAIVFPADYWHDFAQRSGQEFGWPLLIAGLVAGGLLLRPYPNRRFARGVPLLAVALLLIGILPTAFNPDLITIGDTLWQWMRGDLFASRRLNATEGLLIITGIMLLVWRGREQWRAWPDTQRETVFLLWALLLPYAVVWFLYFSYHYRLSFAIVPLLVVQVAALIDGWLWDWLAAQRTRRMVGVLLMIGVIGVALAAQLEHSIEVWREGGLPDDAAKYDRGNPALMVLIHALETYAAEHGAPVVVAPAEDRLPFFFPEWEIYNSRDYAELPTRTEDLHEADIYIETSPGVFLLHQAHKWPNALSAEAAVSTAYHQLNALGWDARPWPTVLEPIPLSPDGSVPFDDSNFRYSMFTLHPTARAAPMQPGALRDDTVIFGEFAQFIGHDVVNLLWVRGETIILSLYWQPTVQAPPAQDYSIYVHLLDADGTLIAQWDNAPLQGEYLTRFWRPGESLLDYWVLHIPPDIPPGPAQVRIGIYDSVSGGRLPVTVDGVPVGDGLTIDTRIEVR